MARLDGDGQPINKNGKRVSATIICNGNSDVHVDSGTVDARAEIAATLYAVMTRFVDRQQGSLKITRSQTGADLHLIWTWTAGEFSGKYVYHCTPYWHLTYGLEVLFLKLREVEAGRRIPTPDKMKSRAE